MSNSTPITPDAGVALGLAATAMPFARDAVAQVERWFRALGIDDACRATPSAPAPSAQALAQPPGDPVGLVSRRASHLATRRGDGRVRTGDLLLAVLEVYGETAAEVLRARGQSPADMQAMLALR